MFPRDTYQAEESFHSRPSLMPPRLPRLRSHPSALGRTVCFENHSDTSDIHRELLSRSDSNPAHRPSYSPYNQFRCRSIDEEGTSRIMLPSMASLMPPTGRFQSYQAQTASMIDLTGSESHQQERPGFFQERYRAQTLPESQNTMHLVSSAALPIATPNTTSLPLEVASAPPLGLAAFANPQVAGFRSSRFDASPRNRSSRWSPYASVSMSSVRPTFRESIAMPTTSWNDTVETEDSRLNHRRRRTSPRRRLAASKARARAMQLMMDNGGEQARFADHIAVDQARPGHHGLSNETQPILFAPPPPIALNGFSLPAFQTPSPFLNDVDTSPSKKNSRYLREIDRRTILARLDRGEKQSALAKEFQVTRAAICNLNKHRDMVLARRYEDPLAKHPKQTKRKQEADGDFDADEAETKSPHRDVSDRISHIFDASLTPRRHSTVKVVALQPKERLMPLLLSSKTSDAEFRRYCDRLMTLVVENALAWAQMKTRSSEFNVPSNSPTSCGVAVVPGGSRMLSIFQEIEPELPTGFIKLRAKHHPSVVLELPPAVASYNVCLFYAFMDADGGMRVAKSIRELLDRGAVEELLCLVTLAVSALTVDALQRAHPNLRIAAAHVESEEDVGDWNENGSSLANEHEHNAMVNDVPTRAASRLQMLARRLAEIY